MTGIADDARRNREAWTRANAEYTDARASAKWAEDEITWGVWGIPEASLGTLGDVEGLDVVDLVELYPPDDAVDHEYYDAFSVEWARRWPAEEIWVAVRR